MVITPHAQCEQGKVIGVGVHIVIYVGIYVLWTTKKIESYFCDQLTVSNLRGRTSRQIYRLTLPLLSPEMLSSSSKSRIFLYSAHLALFVGMDDTITHTNESVSIVI